MKDSIAITLVEDAIEAIDKILSYLNTINSLSEFMESPMVIDAVTRNYEIIGEASSRMPQKIKDEFQAKPWKQMKGLRNLAIHEYHKIDPVLLWEIAENHLLDDKIQLEELLKFLSRNENN